MTDGLLISTTKHLYGEIVILFAQFKFSSSAYIKAIKKNRLASINSCLAELTAKPHNWACIEVSSGEWASYFHQSSRSHQISSNEDDEPSHFLSIKRVRFCQSRLLKCKSS